MRASGSGFRGAVGAGTRRSPTSTTTGLAEVVQAVGFARGTTDRWPELQELAMGNDEFLHDPRNWPRFGPGDDLSGHAAKPLRVRGGQGSILGHRRGAEPGSSRGSAAESPSPTWTATARSTSRSPTSGQPRRSTATRAAAGGRSSGCTCCCPVDPSTDRADAVTAGSSRRRPRWADRPWGRRRWSGCPTAASLRAQVDGGNGHSGKRSFDLHFGLGDAGRGIPLAGRADLA